MVTEGAQETAAFAEGSFVKDHDVILNRLEGPTRFYWLPKDRFERTLPLWDGLPVIFAPRHPNAAMFMVDPDRAVELVGGRQVGTTSAVRIDSAGGTKLKSVLKIDDPEVERLINDEDVSLGISSTFQSPGGFRMRPDGLREPLGDVEPGHVLLFVPDAEYKQGDEGAWVLNQSPQVNGSANMPDETAEKGKLAKIAAILLGKDATAEMQEAPVEAVATAAETVVEEVIDAYADWDTARFIKKIAELEALISQLKAPAAEETVETEVSTEVTTEQVAEMQARIKVLTADRDVRVKVEADKQWAEMMERLPQGVTHGKETELRKRFDADPKEFALFALKHHSTDAMPGESGAEFMEGGSGTTEPPKPTAWDPRKKEFVEA